MKLAFVIPAHNEERLVGKCLTALVAQVEASGCDAEIVVVNNASTDRTREIAAGFKGVRVVDEPAKGLVNARARGLDETTAELVANLDADTAMPPGWIDTVLREFAADSRLVALSGPFFYYDLSPVQNFLVRLFYLAAYPLYLINRYVLKVGSMVQGGNFVFRRSAWLSVGGYDRSIQFYGEDTDVARRLNKVGKVKWTFALPINASGRRLASEGIFLTGFKYFMNYFWVTFFGRPFDKTYRDIRPD